jgi:hypothetical protein
MMTCFLLKNKTWLSLAVRSELSHILLDIRDTLVAETRDE